MPRRGLPCGDRGDDRAEIGREQIFRAMSRWQPIASMVTTTAFELGLTRKPCSSSWRPWPAYRWRGRSTAGPSFSNARAHRRRHYRKSHSDASHFGLHHSFLPARPASMVAAVVLWMQPRSRRACDPGTGRSYADAVAISVSTRNFSPSSGVVMSSLFLATREVVMFDGPLPYDVPSLGGAMISGGACLRHVRGVISRTQRRHPTRANRASPM